MYAVIRNTFICSIHAHIHPTTRYCQSAGRNNMMSDGQLRQDAVLFCSINGCRPSNMSNAVWTPVCLCNRVINERLDSFSYRRLLEKVVSVFHVRIHSSSSTPYISSSSSRTTQYAGGMLSGPRETE